MGEKAEGGKERRGAEAGGALLFLLFFFGLLFAIGISFLIGRYPVGPGTVLRMLLFRLFGVPGNWNKAELTVVLDIRLPRILAAMLVGSALAISGAAYQGIFKNPMVSPDILGASAGAGIGAAIALLLGFPPALVQITAFAFGILAVFLAYSLSRALGKGEDAVLLLVLCGMVISTLCQSGISFVKYVADPNSTLPEITYWLMGSIAKVSYRDLRALLPAYGIGLLPLLLLRWRLNVLSLGEEEAKALGINTGKIRLITIISSTLLTAATVSVAGIVGFVGLMVPHLVRFIAGPNYRRVLPLSVLAGACFLLLTDDLCRGMLPYEIPLGILSSVIGGPFFVLILFQRRGGNL